MTRYHDITEDPSSPYFIGPKHGPAPTGDEIRAEVVAQVDHDIADDDFWVSRLLRGILRDSEIQRLYAARIAGSRADAGLELRPDPGAPVTLWDNATHEEMVSAISTDADPWAAGVTAEEWVGLGNELTLHQEFLAGAINDSLANWSGQAGDAARTGLAELGRWLGTTAQAATLTGRQQEIHSQALNETQRLMAANPPVTYSPTDAAAHLATITDPVAYAVQLTEDATAAVRQQAARDQAARLMTQFDQTIAAAAATPYFAEPPSLTEAGAPTALGSTAPAKGGPASGGGEGGSALRRGVSGLTTPDSAGLPDDRAVPKTQLASGADGQPGAGGRASGGSAGGAGSGAGGGNAGSAGGGGGVGGSRGGQTALARSGGPGAQRTGGPGAQGSPGDGLAGSRSVGGPGDPLGSGVIGGPGATGEPAQGRSGGGMGGVAGERSGGHPTGRGFPGGANEPGAGGAARSTGKQPPAGGAGKNDQSEDNEEYRLADYLLGDLDLFDSDVVVAPPTIGA